MLPSYSMMAARPAPRLFAGSPDMCGHRGCGRGVVDGHAENTLGSCLAAAAAGLRWLELDARLTADGVLVAHHDPRVADGRDVAALSADETDALGIARMADLLRELPGEVSVDLELKTALEDALRPADETTAVHVARLAEAESGRRRILVTSFDPAAITIVRDRAPSLPLGLITWFGFPLRQGVPAAVHLGVQVLAAHVSSFPLDQPAETARLVDVAHQAGLEVLSWCPEAEEVDPLAAAGVDCLVIDDVLGVRSIET
jgi:glycerophosphoryl diester phosphodiesterase